MNLRPKSAILAFSLSAQILCLLAVTPAAGSPKRSSRLPAALVRPYQKASELFDEKKFEAALEQFNQVIAKQADYMPAKLFAARCLYHLKRNADAFKLFQLVDAEIFDPISNYEAGQTAYSLGNFAWAASAFKRIPEGHSLFDMAGYYGGISAFKVGDFETSIMLFEQAVVLPSKFVKTQQAYLREAERLQANRLRLERENKDKGRDKEQPPKPEPTVSLNLPNVAMDVSSQERSYRFLRPVRSVELLPRVKLQEQEKNANRGVDSFVITREEIGLNMGFSHEDSARSAHYVLQARGAFYGLQGSGREIPLFADVRREQEIYAISKEAPKTVVFLEGDAGIEWPIRDTHTLGLNFGVYSHMPNHYKVGNLFSPWGGVFYGQSTPNIEVLLNAQFHLSLDDEKVVKSTGKQGIYLGFALPSSMRLNLQGEFYEFFYENDKSPTPTDGPEWTTRGSAEIGYQKDSFGIFVGGIYETSNKLRLHYIPDTKAVEFSTELQGLTVRSEYEFWNVMRLGAALMDVSRTPFEIKENEAAIRSYYLPRIREYNVYINLFDSF